jgi:hypothetical protein
MSFLNTGKRLYNYHIYLRCTLVNLMRNMTSPFNKKQNKNKTKTKTSKNKIEIGYDSFCFCFVFVLFFVKRGGHIPH